MSILVANGIKMWTLRGLPRTPTMPSAPSEQERPPGTDPAGPFPLENTLAQLSLCDLGQGSHLFSRGLIANRHVSWSNIYWATQVPSRKEFGIGLHVSEEERLSELTRQITQLYF